ncbi:cytidylate kinase-like family protein [Clostridium sp. MSTE9]|nr:cytidylate kinase-like family protein [Clostridium sp. MSTE9]
METMEHIVITIARGFGTGGREIAARLADRLGIHSYANRILTLASQYSGRDEHDFVEVDERLRDGYLRQQLMSLQKRLTPLPHTNPFESDDRLFEFQKKIIQELARTESCVIVGKCADYVLQDFDNVLSVYVEARRVFCVDRVMKTMNVSESEAHSLIAKTDKYRAEYYKYYTGGNYWTNPVNYDMTLNSGRWSIDQCVDLIVQALQIKFGDDCKKAFPFI